MNLFFSQKKSNNKKKTMKNETEKNKEKLIFDRFIYLYYCILNNYFFQKLTWHKKNENIFNRCYYYTNGRIFVFIVFPKVSVYICFSYKHLTSKFCNSIQIVVVPQKSQTFIDVSIYCNILSRNIEKKLIFNGALYRFLEDFISFSFFLQIDTLSYKNYNFF